MNNVFIGVVILVVTLCLMLFYVLWQMGRLPGNRPEKIVKQTGKKTVVLMGDSITHGQIGENYVSILGRRLDQTQYTIVNAGVNSYLAWNLLQRVDEIVSCKPDYVTILIGTNDANAATSNEEAEDYVKRMKLPQMPTINWFRECLSNLVMTLQNETSASIALISIPPIGEKFNHPAFSISSEYVNVIHEIAYETGVVYLPLHEEMTHILKEYSGDLTYPFEKAKMGMIIACTKRYILGNEWNSIGLDAGFQLHVDYLHLNTKGAHMIVDLIENFINFSGITP